jgi:hypothetical protein
MKTPLSLGVVVACYMFCETLLLTSVDGANCTGSISLPSYEALESLYNSTAGWNWKWDPLEPLSTIWQFPSHLDTPCSSRWQGLDCAWNVNGSMCVIRQILLRYRDLTGSLPSELGNIISLAVFGVEDNTLSGTIPTELGKLVNLKSIYMNDNSFEGPIPAEFGNLVNLTQLAVYANFLDGEIPTTLGNLLKMDQIYAYNNFLYGSIPSELGRLTNLEALALTSNLLTSGIPTELGNLIVLQSLYLNENLLFGGIPSELGSLGILGALYLDENSLGGSIPLELGQLPNLVALSVNNNQLAGTLELSRFRCPLLMTLNVSNNALTGTLEALVGNDSLALLEVLDASNNLFTGTLSDSVFLLPSLNTIILSQNCFSGSLPLSLCSNSSAENVILDLLTANCGSMGSKVLQGFVLRQYMRGSIPSCIWNSSTIRTLHLLGNGLTGSVQDLSESSQLSVLALGSNQLTGTIPISFQLHNFAQLDLAINRFTGTLQSDLFVNQTATVYDLSSNRLSGHIPNVLFGAFEADTVNVLQGNLFNCHQDDIPSSDVSHNSYQCGSVDFQYSLIAWLVGAGISFVAFLVAAVLLKWGPANQFVQLAVILGNVNGQLYCVALALVWLVVYVAVKIYGGREFSTHANQYWWTSTIVFTHGWVVTVLLLLMLASLSAMFILTIVSSARKKDIHNSTELPAAPGQLKRFSVHSVNVMVVTAVNALYIVLAVGTVNNIALLSVQTALGIFKLVWSTIVIRSLLTLTMKDPSKQLPDWIFMVLFVFLGAPFASSFCESSSCFLYVLVKSNPISVSFVIPTVLIGPVCGVAGCVIVTTTVNQIFQSSILPPWMYSYQCSSAVVTNYVPVLMLSYLISGIVIPLAVMLVASYRSLAFTKVLPMLLLQIASTDEKSAVALLENYCAAKLGRNMTIKYTLNTAVLLTFGLAVPLLAIAIFCDTLFNLAIIFISLEKLCKEGGKDIVSLKKEFWRNFGFDSVEVAGCCYIVVGYVSIFWSLFAFDWIGDVFGSLCGGLAMLVPLLMPMLIAFMILRRSIHREQRGNWRTNSRSRSDDVEFAETSNPIRVPQATNDDFYTKRAI